MTKLLQIILIYHCFCAVINADSECRQKSVLEGIYTSLHDAITKYAIKQPDVQHVDLLPIGKMLDYDDFNPGKKSRFATPGTLPLKVIENALSLVDKIFPTGATVKPAPVNHSQSDKDYHFDSLSSTFDFVLTHMMVKPRNFSSEEKLRAKYYLQELVPNPELIIQNKTELPRYLLYDYYRSLYLKEKEDKESQMDIHRESLTQEGYENWGVQKLPSLESDSDAAFQKWMIFGYKSEVEQELQYFDIDSHEDTLMSTRALFKSMAVYSTRDPHVQVYPFRLEPEDWFQSLALKQPESSDELRYRLSLLKAQQALMNATRNDLADKTNEDVSNSLTKIRDIMAKLQERVENAVDTLVQMEVDCFAKVNLTVCGSIIDTHTAFRLLLDTIAEHYEQAAYLESILNGREETVSVLRQKLIEVAVSIKDLSKRVLQAQDAETGELIDLSTGRLVDKTSSATCMEAGKIQFTYQSLQEPIDTSKCSQEIQNDESKKYCADVRVPLNAAQSPLWSVHSCAVDHDLKAFDNLLSEFQNAMNTIDTEITASLHRVDVHRPWLDEKIFQDSDHYTMKRNRGFVSPGPLSPLNYFHQVAQSGRYLMAQFTSSFVLATNVSIFFPGLGSWRDEQNIDVDNHTNAVINMLMKYAYAPTLEGGYGPFTLAPEGGTRKASHNFRVERKRGGVLLQIPGAQLIGFISSVIPKFPENQGPAPEPVSCILEPLQDQDDRRQRRSILEDTPKTIRKLSNRLFSEKMKKSQGQTARTEHHLPSESLDDLLREADNTHNKINKLLEKIDSQENDMDSPAALLE